MSNYVQDPIAEDGGGAVPGAAPGDNQADGGPAGPTPVVHGSYEPTEDDEEPVMVKTEFVWADGAEHDVKLSGAWNGWMPVQMYHEGGGMHSVVTPVPAGTHEFKFVVDGEWRHSTRHPTVGDDDETMNNIRVIRGPPKNRTPAPATPPPPQAQPQYVGPGEGTQGDTRKQKGCCVIS